MPRNWSCEGERTFLLESQAINKPVGINRFNYPFAMHKLFVYPLFWLSITQVDIMENILMDDSPRMIDNETFIERIDLTWRIQEKEFIIALSFRDRPRQVYTLKPIRREEKIMQSTWQWSQEPTISRSWSSKRIISRTLKDVIYTAIFYSSSHEHEHLDSTSNQMMSYRYQGTSNQGI